MRADFLLLQKLIKINEDKEEEKKGEDDNSDQEVEKDKSIVDKVKDKEKGDSKESPLQKELKNTCKCPNCGYIGASKEFKVELVNSDDE